MSEPTQGGRGRGPGSSQGRRKITPQQYQEARDEGYSDVELRQAGYDWDVAPSEAAPVDRVDQTTVRNPEGQDPLVKYGVPAAKLYATVAGGATGAAAGLTAAKVLAGKAGRGFLGRTAIGALSGITGGMGARATGNALEGRNPAQGLLQPHNMKVDAALGAVVPVGSALVGGAKKLAGLSPRSTTRETLHRITRDVAERQGMPPEELADRVQKAGGAGGHASEMAVMDLDPVLQGAAASASRHSPQVEREMERFVTARAHAPTQGALADIETSLGGKAADVATTAKRMKAAIKHNDNLRFTPIWETHKEAIVEPKIVNQVHAIFENVAGAQSRLVSGQKIAMKPVSDLLQFAGDDNDIPVVTLQGLHRIKTMLDKAISAGTKAEAAGTLSSDAAFALRDMKVAKQQLLDLDLAGIPGAKEYKAALAASSRERGVVDALLEGSKAVGAKVSPREVESAIAELTDPQAAQAYRRAFAGRVASRTKETGSMSPLVKNQNLSRKLASVATSPQAAAGRTERLQDWQAMEQTNRMQGTIKPPPFTLSGSEAGSPGIAGSLGASQAVGQMATGNVSGAQGGLALWLGNTLFRGAIARNRKAQQAAWEKIAPWLMSQPGEEAATTYRALLKEFGDWRRAKTLREAALSGGFAGGVAGSRNP